ncbi:MAG: hypothetical protein IH819_12585, partial [Bacteroidetes bacterium]|nr:hypothetical protein [Bacteroidota bacterium]
LILTTLYDTGVVEEFRKEFEIISGGRITGRAIEFIQAEGKWWLTGVIGIVLVIFYFIRKFRREIKKRIRDMRFKRSLLR